MLFRERKQCVLSKMVDCSRHPYVNSWYHPVVKLVGSLSRSYSVSPFLLADLAESANPNGNPPDNVICPKTSERSHATQVP